MERNKQKCANCYFSFTDTRHELICAFKPPVKIGMNSVYNPQTNFNDKTPVFGQPITPTLGWCGKWKTRDTL